MEHGEYQPHSVLLCMFRTIDALKVIIPENNFVCPLTAVCRIGEFVSESIMALLTLQR